MRENQKEIQNAEYGVIAIKKLKYKRTKSSLLISKINKKHKKKIKINLTILITKTNMTGLKLSSKSKMFQIGFLKIQILVI